MLREISIGLIKGLAPILYAWMTSVWVNELKVFGRRICLLLRLITSQVHLKTLTFILPMRVIYDPKGLSPVITQKLAWMKKFLPWICPKFCQEHFVEEKKSFQQTVFAWKIKNVRVKNDPKWNNWCKCGPLLRYHFVAKKL